MSIYFSAGHPKLEDTLSILEKLQSSGVDMVEIGLPFSDPLADGPTIQKFYTSITKWNDDTKTFSQLKMFVKKLKFTLVIMGYLNPMMQYGIEKFCQNCQKIGIDGLIILIYPLIFIMKIIKAYLKNMVYTICF